MKRIVIIGGMGPQASLELHRRLLGAAAANGAINGDDFPEILHISIPVPDFINSGSQKVGLQRIKKSLAASKFKKTDRLVLACNTAHLLLPEIENLCGARFTSLIDAAIEDATSENVTCVGVLASPKTLEMKLYQKPLENRGIRVVTPSQQELDALEKAIRLVIANKPTEALVGKLEPVLERMRQAGAKHIILGCTELSVIFRNTKDIRLVDPLDTACRQLIISR